MKNLINRRTFLHLTGAAGLGLGFLSRPGSRKTPVEHHPFGSKKAITGNPLPGKPDKNRVNDEQYDVSFQWSADELWEQSVSLGLIIEKNRILLDDHLLVEEDAPGLGSVRREAWELIEQGVTLEKRLWIERWPVRKATLAMLVYPVQPQEPMSGGKLEFRINGHTPLIYEVRHFWTSLDVPVEYLRQGENRIEVTTHGESTKFRTPIALYSNYPYGSTTRKPPSQQQSRKSIDDGRNWTELLGEADNGGEYPLRLKLRSYTSEGWLQTPVIDLSATEDVLHFPVSVEAAQLDLTAEGEGELNVQIRSGSTHRPESGEWTDWQALTQNEVPAGLRNRYIQLKLTFRSGSGDATPQIRDLKLTTRIRLLKPEQRDEIFLIHANNRPVVDSPWDFQHEDPMFPELQEFRSKYRLDEVVEGAENELETILRLRNWSASRWDWFMPDAEQEDMIQWNSDQILDPAGSRESGGYCLYFSVVFAQACQSFGFPVRMVNVNYAIFGGHEVIEVWSREFNKWFMVDPNFDSMFVSTETGEPLHVLEMHEMFLDAYYPGEVVNRDEWTDEERDRRGGSVDPETLPLRWQTDGFALSGQIDDEYVWWKVTEGPAPGYAGGYGFFNTAYVRWVPRSNWLSQPWPMPVTHGRTHWGWDGYLAWADDQTPETPEHRHFVRRASDLYGSLFTVDFRALPSAEEKGVVEIHLATDSPGFDHFELIDQGNQAVTKKSSWRWELASGVNTLMMRTVDVMGNKGPVSEVTVNYMPV